MNRRPLYHNKAQDDATLLAFLGCHAPAIFYLVEKLSGATVRPILPQITPQPLHGEGD